MNTEVSKLNEQYRFMVVHYFTISLLQYVFIMFCVNIQTSSYFSKLKIYQSFSCLVVYIWGFVYVLIIFVKSGFVCIVTWLMSGLSVIDPRQSAEKCLDKRIHIQTDRQTDRQRDRQKDRQKGWKKKERKEERKEGRKKEKQTDRQMHKEVGQADIMKFGSSLRLC